MFGKGLSVALACLIAASALAQPSPDLVRRSAVKAARVKSLTPRATFPVDTDWPRVERGYAFAKAHTFQISITNLCASLVSTYACKDIEPVLVHTKELIDHYTDRVNLTGKWVLELEHTPEDKDGFIAKNYKRAYDLGEFHRQIGASVTPKDLGWNPAERVVLNQQAFAFVFYSFAWQPIESMLADHQIDEVKDAQAIEDYIYSWSVLGRGMGLDEVLLPHSAAEAKKIITLIRAEQYPGTGEAMSKDVDTLLKNEMAYIRRTLFNGAPETDAMKKRIVGLLGHSISTSPGLSEALGLGSDPVAGLTKLAG